MWESYSAHQLYSRKFSKGKGTNKEKRNRFVNANDIEKQKAKTQLLPQKVHTHGKMAHILSDRALQMRFN